MNILLVQILLIVAVVAVMVRLLRSQGQRTQAVRRLGLVAFAGLAVLSILLPDIWNKAANIVGVGRGTDMILYALVVVFLSFIVTTYLRFRELEDRYTKLARSIALDQARAQEPTRPPGAARPPEAPSGQDGPATPGDG